VGTLSPLGRWKFDRSSWIAVLGEPRQAPSADMLPRDAHEGPLVDETSERHLDYQIRCNYQSSITGILFHCYTVGGRRPELVNCTVSQVRMSSIRWLFCQGYASAASHLDDGAYNRQLSFLLGESSAIRNGSRICRSGRWTPQAAAGFPTLDEIGKPAHGSSISRPCRLDEDPKNSLVFLSTNVSKPVSY
jgi:hypothetical protein